MPSGCWLGSLWDLAQQQVVLMKTSQENVISNSLLLLPENLPLELLKK